MHIRRSPSGDGPTHLPAERVGSFRAARSAGPGPSRTNPIPSRRHPRDSLLMRVEQTAAARSSPSWSRSPPSRASARSCGGRHNQDVKAGGRGLEPLVVQAPTTPSRIKPENAGGLAPSRTRTRKSSTACSPAPCRPSPRSCCPVRPNPKLPASGILPTPAAPKPPDAEVAGKTADAASTGRGRRPRLTPKARGRPAQLQPATNTPPTTESGPSIASLIDNMSGPIGGWRVQVASVKSEDVAKSTWARLQSAHGDVDGQPAHAGRARRSRRQGVWYRVQARPARREAGAERLQHRSRPARPTACSVPPAR